MEIFDSQTKVKKKNLETNGKKIKKDINKLDKSNSTKQPELYLQTVQ